MPFVPELFSAPALARIEGKRRLDELVAVPYFDGLMAGEPDALEYVVKLSNGTEVRGERLLVSLEVLSDAIQPFPSFSSILDSAYNSLRMQVASMPPPAHPMQTQMAAMTKPTEVPDG